MAMATKKANSNNRSPEQIKERKMARMEKKVVDLNKRYPSNKYVIKENATNFTIVRLSGKAPAKIKKEAAKQKGNQHAR